MNVTDLLSRRQILLTGSLGAAAWLVPGVFAEELARTPRHDRRAVLSRSAAPRYR